MLRQANVEHMADRQKQNDRETETLRRTLSPGVGQDLSTTTTTLPQTVAVAAAETVAGIILNAPEINTDSTKLILLNLH